MAERASIFSPSGGIDDRKRARAWLARSGVSPKKGKTAFSFPAFETELNEIEQQCQKGAAASKVCSCSATLGAYNHAETTSGSSWHSYLTTNRPAVDCLVPIRECCACGSRLELQLHAGPCEQTTLAQDNGPPAPDCSAVGLWQGMQRELLHNRQTPEPLERKPLQPRNQGLTPPVCQSLQCSNVPVQTLHARSMPLSPFEYGEVPTDGGSAPPDLVSSPSCAQLPDDNALVTDEGSAPSPAAFSEAAEENDPVETSAGTSFRCASELEGSMAMMTDIPLSQSTSQESSLVESKILKPPGMRSSHDLSEPMRDGFLFSRTFSFLGLLGDTKTCSVYHARGPGGSYAIKEIKRPFASKADRADMLKEYTAVHSLPDHPNVVHYLLFWQEFKKLHIQMELCEGGSLDTLLKRNELSGDEDLQISEAMVWVLVSDAAMALKHIHDHGVIHMDVKPENIFLKASGVFKVGDFGIAVRVPVTGGWEEGDGRYVAPELLRRSHAPTAAADVYSLGATILHSATGSISREDRTPACAAQKLEAAGFSQPLQQLVASMLAAQAQQRPSTQTICDLAEEQLSLHNSEVLRHKLQAVAQALQEQRLSQLHALHGSASFNQSHDQGTPGEQLQKTGASKETEKPWGALFSRQSKPPNSAGGDRVADMSLRIPPLPTGSRANILADRGRAAMVDRVAGHPQGVGTPPSVAPQPRQLHRQRSPSVGSLRCGALSYSSNGQASGSLNLEVNNELSIGADGPLERHTSLMGGDAQRSLQHSDRQKLFRSSTLGRQHLLGRPSSLRPADHNAPPLRFPTTANSSGSLPDREVEDSGNCPTPSPKAAVLNRYFSSQLADKFMHPSNAPDNEQCRAARDTGCSQIEVTGPSEEGRVSGGRSRRSNPMQPPPTLSNLYERVARTKGREMVQKGLRDVAAAEGSSVPTALEDSASGAVSTERSVGMEGLFAGKGSTRRTRGLKIASMAAGGKENSSVPVAHCSSGCKEQVSPMQGRPLSLASVKGCFRSPRVVSGVLRPHRLNFTSALASGGKPKDATGILSSARPELSVPPSFGRVLQMPRL